MSHTELATALSRVFAELPKSYDEVRYALEGDAKFKPPQSVVRKVLADFAKESGCATYGYLIQKAFDAEPDFVRDLAITAAASYAFRTKSA